MMMHSYFSMFVIMMISGILSSMNIWVDNVDDIRISLNDIYMSLLMSGWMILFMATLDKNITMLLVGISIITISFIAIRLQLFVNEKQYLLGMIPHHSMAVTMSKKLQEKIQSSRNTLQNNSDILALLNQIISSQQKEIQFMKSKLLSIP